jgi:peptide deformylase
MSGEMNSEDAGTAMSTRAIYLYGSDMLREKAKTVTAMDDSLVKLVYDMFETMHKANGIGLAATQVGDTRRVIVIDISDVNENAEEADGEETEEGEVERHGPRTSAGLPRTLALINPEIIASEGSWVMEEGCLSIPDVRAEVERPEKIRIRFRDTNFQEQVLDADGLLARVIQHEYDHLDGVLFVDRISGAKRTLLKSKLRRIKEGDVETSYPVAVES